MMDDRLPTDWGDERLAAAFAARSSRRPSPRDLVPATIERLRVDPRPVRTRFGFAHLGGAAAAAVVLAVVAVGVFGPRPTTEPGETHAATFGLEPITVSEAITIRDAGIDDREIAVRGWYASAGPVPCPAPPDFLAYQNPARPWCPMTLRWVMERPERLVDASSTRIVGTYPTGPAFNPSLTLVGQADLPQDPSIVVPVTFIGHFDDRRAVFCPDDEKSSCVDTFVVDRVAVLDGRVLGTPTVRELEQPPASTEATIDERVRSIDQDLRVLSRRATTADLVGATEPVFLGRRGPLDPDTVWLIAALPPLDSAGRAVVRTFLIPDDGSDPILEITDDGEVPVSEVAPPATGPTPQTTIVGDPITVAEAIDHRDNHLDDTELAIRGFAWRPLLVLSCAIRRESSPAARYCNDTLTWISDLPPTGNASQPAPDEPAMNLLIRQETHLGVNPLQGEPVEVIVLGHFDDHRAALCAEEVREECRRNFVVDAVLNPANSTLDRAQMESFRPDETAEAIATAAEAESWASVSDPSAVVAAFPVGRAMLRAIEPAVATAAELDRVTVVWIVRFVERDAASGRAVVRTVLVPDRATVSLGWPVAYEVTATGLVRRQPASSISVGEGTVICGFLSAGDCQTAAAAVIEAIASEAGSATTIEMSTGHYCPIPDRLFAKSSCPGAPLPWRGADAIGSALVSYEGEPAKSYLNLYRDASGIKARFIATAIASD